MSLPVHAQKLIYEIKAIGINAGTLEVSKTSANGLDQYLLESHSSVNYLFGTIKVDHITRSTYKNGILQNSYVRNDKNDKVEYYSSIDFDGSTYTITNDEGKKTYAGEVRYAISHLFFQEPVDKTEIFSERFGQNIPIKNKGNHTYEFTFPNGEKFTYYYENGIIIKSDMPSPIGKAHLYLKK